MKLLITLAALLFVSPHVAFSQDRSIAGQVVDSKGRPVANASVATFWRANGSGKKSDGTALDLQDEAELQAYWGRLGQMEPVRSTETSDDGSFSISLKSRDRALFALNADRTQGCIFEVSDPAETQSPITMRLTRLVTVTAEFRSSVAKKSIDWCHAYLELPLDPKYPLANNRLITCGSFDGRFEVRLPAGHYQLDAYAVSDSDTGEIDLRVNPSPRFTVRETDRKLNIGVLNLAQGPPTRGVLEGESKQAGRWKDYTKHYGEPAPDWHSVDGRGLDHQKNIKSLRGKWVILDFWGLSCAPCLGRGIPKMMEFYERNAKSKARFEVIGVCIDFTGEIDEMAELDEALSSFEAHVWKGKKIPFPIVLDNTFNTWERYGIPGLGTVVLVDPEGRIVKGDDSTLQVILDNSEH